MNSVFDQSPGDTSDNSNALADDNAINTAIALEIAAIVKNENKLWKDIPSKEKIAHYQDSFNSWKNSTN